MDLVGRVRADVIRVDVVIVFGCVVIVREGFVLAGVRCLFLDEI